VRRGGQPVQLAVTVLDPTLGLWGLFLSAFISSTIAPGGSEAVLAYLVHGGTVDSSVLLLTATVGNTLGAMTTWLLGVWAARKFGADEVRDPKKRRAIDTVRRWGWPILLFSWLPVIGDGFCFGAGWLRMSAVVSMAAIATGKLVRYAAIVYWFAG
jgi:membrane protein YqaA with SNARE-associated domain